MAASQVHVWRCRLAAEPPTAVVDATLSLEERERAARMTRADVRAEFLAAHVLLRRILAQWTGRSADELVFDTRCAHCGDPHHGRPTLAGRAQPAFNLSRRPGLAAIAVSDAGAVGVDVERLGPAAQWHELHVVAFTGAERAALGELAAEDAARAAAALWTRKEAVAKALGLGLAGLAPDELAVGPWAAGGWIEIATPTHASAHATRVHDVAVPDGYAAAVALTGATTEATLVLHDL